MNIDINKKCPNCNKKMELTAEKVARIGLYALCFHCPHCKKSYISKDVPLFYKFEEINEPDYESTR